MIMVHYVRFLKTARVVNQTSTSICVRALATITTDLGDSFLASDAKLTSSLVAADDIGKVLCKNDILWQGGSRELPLEAVWHITGQNIPLLRLHVCHVKGRSSPIPSIVDAWSATFEPTPDFRSAALIERQLSLPCLPVLKVWEDTGNTISRHIWDAALGCLLCFQDVLSSTTRMPDLANVLRGRRSERINVLELGAGCGIVGIALAQYFPNAVVQLTDLADAQDILSKNLDQATPAKNSILKAWTLVWDAEPDEADFNYNFDLVMISDCTYNADSCPDLVATLARVSSISPGVRILVAMKRRHDSEHIFFDLMADAHMRVLERSTIELPHEMSNLDLKTPETELYLFGCIADGQSTPDPTITA